MVQSEMKRLLKRRNLYWVSRILNLRDLKQKVHLREAMMEITRRKKLT